MNFKALLDEAVQGRQLIRSLAYVVTTGEEEEKPFLDALTKASFEVQAKELQIFAGGAKKGDWDIGIAMDAIRLAPTVDAVILATGDGDFIPLVNYLQTHFGVQVELLAFGGSVSGKLIDTVDDFTDIGKSEFLITIPKRRQSAQTNVRSDGSRRTGRPTSTHNQRSTRRTAKS